MPEKSRGSVSARFSVWFSRVRAARNARQVRVEHLEAAAIEVRESASPRARGGARRASSCSPRSGGACRPGSRTPRATLPGDLRAALLPVEPAGDHQVEDEEQVALELEDDPLAEAPEADDPLPLGRASGGSNERSRNGLASRTADEPLADDRGLERRRDTRRCRAAPARAQLSRGIRSPSARGIEGERFDELDRPLHPLAPHPLAGGHRREAARGPRGRHDRGARRPHRRRSDRRSAPEVLLGLGRARRAAPSSRSRTSPEPAAADPEVLDLAIVGGGVSGLAAAIEAKKAGLSFAVFEATEVFSTVANFPKGKPIYTYPTGMTPAGDLQFRSEVHPKEQLLEDAGGDGGKAAGIEVTFARIERIERQGGVSSSTTATGRPSRGPPRHRRDRPQRQPPPARRPGRGPRQGLQPALRPQGIRGPAGPRRRRRRLGARDRDRARRGRRARHALLPQEGVRAAQARERREAPDAREEPVGATSRSSTRPPSA